MLIVVYLSSQLNVRPTSIWLLGSCGSTTVVWWVQDTNAMQEIYVEEESLRPMWDSWQRELGRASHRYWAAMEVTVDGR